MNKDDPEELAQLAAKFLANSRSTLKCTTLGSESTRNSVGITHRTVKVAVGKYQFGEDR